MAPMCTCGHHDRLDQVLHAQEYVEMKCGSMKNVHAAVPGQPPGSGQTFTLVGDGLGGVKQEPAYCCNNCPTLIAAHVAAATADTPAAG